MDRRIAVVTGGSRGIGKAIVQALAAGGWRVAFTWLSDGDAAHDVETATGGAAVAFRLDVRERGAIDETFAAVEEKLGGPVEALVNNAGMRRDSLLAMTSDREWDEVIDVNLGAVFRCCRSVLPGMVRRRGGSIVNVASLSALHGLAGQTAYAAAKSGVLGMTRSLAREMGKRNIRVNAVVPGFVATDLTADLTPDRVAALRARECLPVGVTALSVAEAVAFLVSDASSSITGQSIVIDAGSTA